MSSMEQQELSLGDLCIKIGSGVTPRGGENVYKQEGVSLIRSQNIYDYFFEYDGLVFIDEEQAKRMKNVEVCPDDILLNITGDSVARCCVVPKRILPARVNQHVSIIRPNTNLISSQYLLYWINNSSTKELLLSLASSGGTRKALTKGMLEKLTLSIPSIEEQKAIADTLSCLDDKIELNNRINKNLEEIARAIFKSWFVDFEPFQDGEFEDNELGRIPKGWKVGTLGDILNLNYGKALPAKKRIGGKIRVYSSAGITGYHNEALINESSIIIGRKGTIGTVYYSTVPSFCIDTAYFATQNDSKFPLLLMYQLLKELNLGQYNEDSAVPGLNRNTVYAINIVIPPDSVLNQCNNILTAIYKLIFDNLNQTHLLNNVRDTLLPKLMSGEIRVPIKEVQ